MDTEHWIDQLDPVSAALYQSQVAIIFFMMMMMMINDKNAIGDGGSSAL